MSLNTDNRISVFITSYNQKSYLIQAIESVLKQTLRPFEIIVVDDCSSDGSQDIILSYAKDFPDLIRPFLHESNLGIPRNKSFALEQVRGDLVTYLDGDDRFLPDKLEKELHCLKMHPDSQIVFSNVCITDSHGKRKGTWIENNHFPPTGRVFPQVFARNYPRRQLFRNELVHYNCLKKVGFFDKQFAMYHDWDLRIRLTKHYNVAYCPEVLAEYRRHNTNISKSSSVNHFLELHKIYRKNRPLLTDESEDEVAFIEQKLFPILSYFGRNAIIDKLEKGLKTSALNLYRSSRLYYSFWINLFLKFLFFIPHRSIGTVKHIFRKYRHLLPYAPF